MEILPRTIRAIDSGQLFGLMQDALDLGFSRRLTMDWLTRHVARDATHYLYPVLVHWLSHLPEHSPQWRCELLLTVRTGEELLGTLDVLPTAFRALPENLDPAAKTRVARRMEAAPSVREWDEGQRGT